MRDCASPPAAQYFAEKATELRKKCLRHPLLKVCAEDSAELAQAKQLIRDQCETVEGFQFLCCEHSKIVRWLMTWNCTYNRGYWEWFAARDPE